MQALKITSMYRVNGAFLKWNERINLYKYVLWTKFKTTFSDNITLYQVYHFVVYLSKLLTSFNLYEVVN